MACGRGTVPLRNCGCFLAFCAVCCCSRCRVWRLLHRDGVDPLYLLLNGAGACDDLVLVVLFVVLFYQELLARVAVCCCSSCLLLVLLLLLLLLLLRSFLLFLLLLPLLLLFLLLLAPARSCSSCSCSSYFLLWPRPTSAVTK